MIIGIPVYQGVDLLDVTAPHEVLKWIGEDIDVRLIARKPNEMITTRDGLTFVAPYGFEGVPSLDVLWVPGGDPAALKADDERAGRRLPGFHAGPKQDRQIRLLGL
jgi:putative intracellular protease/amidase